jgi:hypothetical protein
LFTFGSVDTPAVPLGINYQRLQHPNGFAMTAVVDTEFFDGKPYVAAMFSNGDVLSFYDGVAVADWNNPASGATIAGKKPVALLTHKEKLYATTDSILAFSAINAPDKFQDAIPFVGSGFKNMSNQSAGSETLTALGRYQDLMAVFARRNIQIWFLDPDPLQNAQRQVLENIGTFAKNSVVSFGDVDVFFLSDSGIRSLRARDSSNQSGVSDVGTPIDEFLLEFMATLTDAQKAAACGVLEPISGRYLLAIGTRIFVFSYFASSRTSAWSTYDIGVQITDFVVLEGRVWARSGDTVYRLGGVSGSQFDSSKVEVDLPYIDGRQLASFKDFTGIDIVCEGEWQVFVNTDPNDPTAESEVAITGSTTLTAEALGIVGHSPLIKLRLVNEAPGPARLSKIVIHYNPSEAS